MPYFPQPHSSQRARRFRVPDVTPLTVIFSDGMQISGQLEAVSTTGGSARLESLLPPSTLVHLTFRTPVGPISAVAEMLPPVDSERQAFRFIGLDEGDRARLLQFMGV